MADRPFRQRLLESGLALQGDFAGVTANRRQIAQQQERDTQRRRGLSLERKQAGATDFRNINFNLKEGLIDRALTGLNRRATAINAFGDSDTQDTDAIRSLIETNRVPEAIQLLDAVDRESVTRGFIDPIPQAKTKVVGDFLVNESTGDVVFDASGAGQPETAKDANGFLRFTSGKDSGKRVFPEVVKAQEELTGKDRASQARNIRNDIAKENSDFTKIANSWDRIAASANDPSAAGDLALIFNFMKMLDPGSTVREGEFATAAQSAGVPDRIRAQYNRVFSGERLAVAQRTDFLNQAQNIFNVSSERANNITEEFVRVAEDLGLRRDEVVISRGAAPVISQTAAPVSPEAPEAPEAPTIMRFDEQGNLIP